MTKLEKAKQIIIESGKKNIRIRDVAWKYRVAFREWVSSATIRRALIELGAKPATSLKGRNSYWIMPK